MRAYRRAPRERKTFDELGVHDQNFPRPSSEKAGIGKSGDVRLTCEPAQTWAVNLPGEYQSSSVHWTIRAPRVQRASAFRLDRY